MKMMRTLPALAFGGLLASCNAYQPDLGYEPFRCGDIEPRCPLDYTCVTFTEGDAICQKTGVEAPDAGNEDAASFSCYDDREVEPNDSLAQAFETGIPERADSFTLSGLSICPVGDEDVFRFEVLASGTNVSVDVSFRPSQGALELDLLNQSGTSIASGAAPAGNPNVLRAAVSDLAVGAYYVQVRGAGNAVQNNYDSLDIVTTPP
jgi:hypothetical protein